MALDKDRIHELTEIFYQKPPFKTFYINSTDGSTFVKPLGVFISLGITTSMKVLTDLRDVLGKTPGLKTSVVEIKSIKIAGQYLNQVITVDPKQYEVSPESVLPNKVLSKDEAYQVLSQLEESGQGQEAQKLRETINRVSEGSSPWVDQEIMKIEDGGYRIFHHLTNYKKTDDAEYRLGIYVEESD